MSTVNELGRVGIQLAAKDAAWDVFPLIMADCKTGEILDVHTFAANIFGYEREELLGQVIEVLVPELQRTSHALWRQDAQVPHTRLMGVGRQICGIRKSGEKFPAQILLTTVETVGRVVGIALIVDLTGVVSHSPEVKT